MTICSDLNCNNDCISWITSNGKCYSTDINFNTITTTSSYAQYSDSSCNVIKPNTYITPIVLDNTCQQLYIDGNQSPIGSYKGFNLSLVIGVIVGSSIFVILVIIWILYCCGVKCCCCCKNKTIQYPQLPNAVIITDETHLQPIQYNSSSRSHYDFTYGYQINQPLYPPLPSAPPAYISPPLPSAPPVYISPPLPSAPPEYISPLPPLPSAPPSTYNEKIV
jgi:hypothetical protein